MVANIMEIIVGTYEEMLIGYSLEQKQDVYSMKQSFTNRSHMGSVRCVSATSKFLATGSMDETINLFNLETRKERGALIHHEGSINSLKFYGDNYLLSGSDDGNICVWQTQNWQCLKTLRGHKKGVTSLSVHPTGKLALSISKDATLRTWNLIKGRSAYVTNIKTVAHLVEWSVTGCFYALVIDNRVDIYSVEKAGIVHTIDYGKNIHSISFLNDDIILIGGESGTIEIHSTLKDSLYCQFKAHLMRVKEMKIVENSKKGDNCWFLITASNDGYIKVWDLNLESLEENPSLLAKTDTGCRITCLTVANTTIKAENKDDKSAEIEVVKIESPTNVAVKRSSENKTKSNKKKKSTHT